VLRFKGSDATLVHLRDPGRVCACAIAWRLLQDLPAQCIPMILRLHLDRGCCRHTGCERLIFTERLFKACAPYAQQINGVRIASNKLPLHPAAPLETRPGP
jgi:hypothetical protein